MQFTVSTAHFHKLQCILLIWKRVLVLTSIINAIVIIALITALFVLRAVASGGQRAQRPTPYVVYLTPVPESVLRNITEEQIEQKI